MLECNSFPGPSHALNVVVSAVEAPSSRDPSDGRAKPVLLAFRPCRRAPLSMGSSFKIFLG